MSVFFVNIFSGKSIDIVFKITYNVGNENKGGEILNICMAQQGLFEVTDTGEVYRIKGSRKELARQMKTGKDGKYRYVDVYKRQYSGYPAKFG